NTHQLITGVVRNGDGAARGCADAGNAAIATGENGGVFAADAAGAYQRECGSRPLGVAALRCWACSLFSATYRFEQAEFLLQRSSGGRRGLSKRSMSGHQTY